MTKTFVVRATLGVEVVVEAESVEEARELADEELVMVGCQGSIEVTDVYISHAEEFVE